MRLIVDLDGTIAQLRKEGETYADVLPIDGAVEALTQLTNAGHYVIIHTARHMKTCNGDVFEVERRVGLMTRLWLARWKIPYNELIFGKPYGDMYIDDLAFKGEWPCDLSSLLAVPKLDSPENCS